MSYIAGLKIRKCPECGMLNREDACTACRKPLVALTPAAYLGGHNTNPKYRDEFTDNHAKNMENLLKRTTLALERLLLIDPTLDMAKDPIITSGWRPRAYNAIIGGSPNSKHIICLAIDLLDPDHKIAYAFMAHPETLAEFDLAIEHPSKTEKPTGFWCHIQVGAPPSGRRVFYP